MQYSKENQFIQKLAPRILKLVESQLSGTRTIAHKSTKQDVASDLDLAVDKLIVRAISSAFPRDILVTEESSPELIKEISAGKRGWIVDPLCGSANVARGIQWFATNIILMLKGKVVAAWAVDHSRKRVIWSVGKGKVFIDKTVVKIPKKQTTLPIVEIDTGYSFLLPKSVQKRYIAIHRGIFLSGAVQLRNLGSSLGFAYIATGQIGGIITLNVYSWDILAAAFLVEQNNGIVTNFDGSQWNLQSKSLIMAGNKTIYQLLFSLVKKYKLTGIV